jgi:hypothetical protein
VRAARCRARGAASRRRARTRAAPPAAPRPPRAAQAEGAAARDPVAGPRRRPGGVRHPTLAGGPGRGAHLDASASPPPLPPSCCCWPLAWPLPLHSRPPWLSLPRPPCKSAFHAFMPPAPALKRRRQGPARLCGSPGAPERRPGQRGGRGRVGGPRLGLVHGPGGAVAVPARLASAGPTTLCDGWVGVAVARGGGQGAGHRAHRRGAPRARAPPAASPRGLGGVAPQQVGHRLHHARRRTHARVRAAGAERRPTAPCLCRGPRGKRVEGACAYNPRAARRRCAPRLWRPPHALLFARHAH